MCLKWLHRHIQLEETLTYSKEVEAEVIDLRGVVNVKNKGNMHFLYRAVPYTQVFGSAFAVNPSIIDLIFCVGPEAARIIKASAVAE